MAQVTQPSGQNNPTRHLVLRPDKRRIAIFGAIAVCILLVSIANGHKGSIFWYSSALYVLGWAIFLLWLASYKVAIDGEILSYTSFGKTSAVVNRGDVLSAELSPRRFPSQVKIERYGDPILINAKPFGGSDLRIVMDFLSDKTTNNP
jgi:hypothetical protein